jgi:hypothetical protein
MSESKNAEVTEVEVEKAVNEVIKTNATIKMLSIKSKASDFKEALEVTRTIHKSKIA